MNKKALLLLRYSLGIIFLWFGVLKLFSVSPVQDIIVKALPQAFAGSQLFWFALSLLEIFIGTGFFLSRTVKLAALVMTGHLIIATLAVLFTQGFSPRFPVLSLEGEFVIKNIALIASGIVLFTFKENP